MAVRAAVDRDYEVTIEARALFQELENREQDILADLPEMNNTDLLRVREILVDLQQTTGYAMRNVEIATNLALDEDSEYVTIR